MRLILHLQRKKQKSDLFCPQNDQSTGEIKVIGGDDLSTLTGKVRSLLVIPTLGLIKVVFIFFFKTMDGVSRYLATTEEQMEVEGGEVSPPWQQRCFVMLIG